jgi:hypothetical protein
VWGLSFLAGVIPTTVLQQMGRATGALGDAVTDRFAFLHDRFEDAFATPRALTLVDGIDIHDSSRLETEGINDIPSLAGGDLVSAMIKTRLPMERLVDWTDQAVLILLLGEDKEEALDERVTALRRIGIRTASGVVAAEKMEFGTAGRDAVVAIVGAPREVKAREKRREEKRAEKKERKRAKREGADGSTDGAPGGSDSAGPTVPTGEAGGGVVIEAPSVPPSLEQSPHIEPESDESVIVTDQANVEPETDEPVVADQPADVEPEADAPEPESDEPEPEAESSTPVLQPTTVIAPVVALLSPVASTAGSWANGLEPVHCDLSALVRQIEHEPVMRQINAWRTSELGDLDHCSTLVVDPTRRCRIVHDRPDCETE